MCLKVQLVLVLGNNYSNNNDKIARISTILCWKIDLSHISHTFPALITLHLDPGCDLLHKITPKTNFHEIFHRHIPNISLTTIHFQVFSYLLSLSILMLARSEVFNIKADMNQYLGIQRIPLPLGRQYLSDFFNCLFILTLTIFRAVKRGVHVCALLYFHAYVCLERHYCLEKAGIRCV